MMACYPHLLGDLTVLCRLLSDLRNDLVAKPSSVLRHGSTLQRLQAAVGAIADVSSSSPTREQLVDCLRTALKQLAGLEEDLASSAETVSQHAFKLQHVDLATQLLTSVIVGAVWLGEVDPVSLARLQNLRASCKQALTGRPYPKQSVFSDLKAAS